MRKLAKDFEVPIPDLTMGSPSGHLAGWYDFDEVHLGSDTLKNMFLTVHTTRHEFAHYLQDLLNLPTSERKAKRFERNILALGPLPKSQTLITKWVVNYEEHTVT